MLSEKQFRERTRAELRQIGDQVLALATDRDLYQRLEREIVGNNPELSGGRSVVLDMVRGCYADAMSARVLRLLDGSPALPAVLASFGDYPQVLQDKITQSEFADDCAALEQAQTNLQCVLVPHLGHHERTLSALAPLHRELNSAIDLLIETVKTYYWIVADCYLDLEVKYADDPLAVFDFAWATPTLAR